MSEEMCDICGINKPSHTICLFSEEDRRLCCKCYVEEGHPPADWHDGCMATYRSRTRS
jgi:hypothetical protein